MKKIKILLVDDHALVRDGLKLVLNSCDDMKVIGEARNGLEALDAINTTKPDIILMDVNMPEMDGLEALEKIAKLDFTTKVILLSMEITPKTILTAYKNGAKGYIAKDIRKDRLLEAIRRVYSGEEYFDPKVRDEIFKNYHGGSFKRGFKNGNKTGLKVIAIIGIEIIAGTILGFIGI